MDTRRRARFLAATTLLLALGACHESSEPESLGLPPGPAPTGFYEALDLGTLGSGSSVAVAIDDSGRVAGTSGGRAFIWVNGKMTALSPDPSSAQYIGTNGDVSGYTAYSVSSWLVTWDAMGTRHAVPMARPGVALGIVASNPSGLVANVAYSTDDVRALLYRGGTETDLGSLSNPLVPMRLTQAHAMNVAGVVVGGSYHHTAGQGWAINHAFAWINGNLTDLGSPATVTCPGYSDDCSAAEAWSINDQGDIVGTAFAPSAGGLNWRPILWSNGTPVDLGISPGEDAWATFINNAGQVAGVVAWNGPFRGWRWQNGAATEFGVLGAEGQVTGMNEQGDVIGTSNASSGDYHAFVYHAGQMIDLGIGSVGPRSMAVAINRHGDIVGWTGSAEAWGVRHAMLWRRH